MIRLKFILWPLKQIDAALPQQGLIIDLGCGDGTVAAYLAGQSSNRRVIGLDTNSSKLKSATYRYHHLTNLSFKSQNILKANLKSAAACLLSDVLHHLSLQDQSALLKHLSQHLPSGSICLIKEINHASVIRSKLSRLWDWLLYPQDKINYYSAPKLKSTMEKLNFKVKYKPVYWWFPGSVNLFVCTKL